MVDDVKKFPLIEFDCEKLGCYLSYRVEYVGGPNIYGGGGAVVTSRNMPLPMCVTAPNVIVVGQTMYKGMHISSFFSPDNWPIIANFSNST